MAILWDQCSLIFKVIRKKLSEEKEVVYTTIFKVMQVMMDRGFQNRESQGRKHIYRAIIAWEGIQNSLLNSFMNRAFGGSVKALAMRALGIYRTSKEDLEDLKALINKTTGH